MEEELSKASAFEEDARYKRLVALVKEFERRAKSQYTHKLKPADEKLVKEALKDLHSIGVQLSKTYLDQLPLLPLVESKKVVQKR